MKDLRELDDRLLPRAAMRVARLADALADRRTRLVRGIRSVELDAAGLKDLDHRYAGSGPLALLRDVPQFGFVVIGLVLVTATGTAVTREAANNRRADQQSVQPPYPGTTLPGGEQQDSGNRTLGPEVGDVVSTYLTTAQRELASFSRSEDKRVALVSLRSYLTPTQLTALTSGYDVTRVYLRSRSGGKDAAQLPVEVRGALPAALTKAYASAAHGRELAQQSYQGYVDTLTVATSEDQAFKDLYAAFAASTKREAKDYRSGCACLYAVVVEASPKQLTGLAGKPGVRGIQVAQKGVALRDLSVLPLLPDVTKVVPQQQAAESPP